MRTMIAASTRCEIGVSAGGNAAIARKSSPSGQRNQPDLPKSVMSSKNEMIQLGRWPTPRMAAASIVIIDSRYTARNAPPAIASWRGESERSRAFPRAGRASTVSAVITLAAQPPQRRGCRAFNAIKSVGHAHGLACERKTVIDTGFPMLIL